MLLRIIEIPAVVRKDKCLSKGEEADWKQECRGEPGLHRVGEPAEQWAGEGGGHC